jgi:hypothetical protein
VVNRERQEKDLTFMGLRVVRQMCGRDHATSIIVLGKLGRLSAGSIDFIITVYFNEMSEDAKA